MSTNGTHKPPATSRGSGMRALADFASALLGRYHFARDQGLTFFNPTTGQWARDLYAQLGYERVLNIARYRSRYMRGGIAERVVEALPQATWAGGADIIEDPDPNTETPFERACRELFERVELWHRLTRADILSGLDTYAVLLIGAPGAAESELTDVSSPDEIAYLLPRASDQVVILEVEDDIANPRFGYPRFYQVKVQRNLAVGSTASTTVEDRPIHWSRVIHVADGLLDDDIYGKPRLRAVWNYLDDLDKLIGGGAEAAWKRMDPGLQIDIDPEIALDEAEEQRLDAEVDEYVHGLTRVMRTRGGKVTPLATQVAGFGPNADAVIKLIAATTGIPYRILTGSEMGQLASTQDRLNWADRINERRRYFAAPLVRQLIHRLSNIGALPPIPANGQFAGGYDIQWAGVGQMDIVTKADVVSKLTGANQAQYIANQPPIITSDEIRQSILDLGPLRPEDIPPSKAEVEMMKAEAGAEAPGPDPDAPEPAGGDGPDITSAP